MTIVFKNHKPTKLHCFDKKIASKKHQTKKATFTVSSQERTAQKTTRTLYLFRVNLVLNVRIIKLSASSTFG